MEGELSRLHGVGVAKHQKGIQASFLPAKDVYAAEFLPVTFKAVLEMLDPLAETRANLVELRDDVKGGNGVVIIRYKKPPQGLCIIVK